MGSCPDLNVQLAVGMKHLFYFFSLVLVWFVLFFLPSVLLEYSGFFFWMYSHRNYLPVYYSSSLLMKAAH